MNVRKQILLVSLLSILFTGFSSLVAGQGIQRSQNLDNERTVFFNREMALTKSESDLFWPVYNDYANRRNKINLERKTLYQYISRNKDYMSEKEVQDALAKFILYQNQETELLEIFNNKFLEILPPKKVIMIYVTENRFKAHILKMIRDNRRAPEGEF